MSKTNGKIQNEKYFKQKVLFKGIRHNSITPTDHDLCFDIGSQNKFFLSDIKYTNFLSVGQERHYEFIIDNLEKAGVMAIFVLASHNENTGNDIIAAKCQPVLIYFNKKWTPITRKITLKKLIKKFCKSDSMKPIKIKKKDRSCPNCKRFTGHQCRLTDNKIPANVYNSGCELYKKNKSIYF